MVDRLSVVAGIALICVGVFTLTMAVAVPSQAPGACDAVLTVEATELDFGIACQHSAVDLRFRLTNTSHSPIALLHATASCGCIVPKLNHRLVGPGDSFELPVKIMTNSMVGVLRKPISVAFYEQSNESPKVRSMTLHVTGNVQPRCRLLTDRIEVTRKAAASRELRVVSPCLDRIRIIKTETSHQCFSTSNSHGNSDDTSELPITIHYDPGLCSDDITVGSVNVTAKDGSGRLIVRTVEITIID